MKEFSQHIQVVPLEGSVTDAFDLMAREPFDLEFTADSDDGGTYWNCRKQIVCDPPDAVVRQFFRYERSCQVKVWDNSGACHVIGDSNMPARVILSPMLQSATLTIACEMIRNPLSL